MTEYDKDIIAGDLRATPQERAGSGPSLRNVPISALRTLRYFAAIAPMAARGLVAGRVSPKDNRPQSPLRDLDEQEGQYAPQGMVDKILPPKNPWKT